MKTLTAAEAKNGFGRYLDAVQSEPVIITKKNRPVALTLSFEDAEDLLLLDKARQAEQSGFIGEQASAALLNKIMNAKG